jgi:hypothetical protein
VSTEELRLEDRLARELADFVEKYSPDRQAADIATQRDFQQGLVNIEQSFADRLDVAEYSERSTFDKTFRLQERWKLNNQERAGWSQDQTRDDLFGNRRAHEAERAKLDVDHPNPPYQQTEQYRDLMQELVEEQATRRDQMDTQLRSAEELLNERFGFDRNPPQEPQLRDFKEDFEVQVVKLQLGQLHERES